MKKRFSDYCRRLLSVTLLSSANDHAETLHTTVKDGLEIRVIIKCFHILLLDGHGFVAMQQHGADFAASCTLSSRLRAALLFITTSVALTPREIAFQRFVKKKTTSLIIMVCRFA